MFFRTVHRPCMAIVRGDGLIRCEVAQIIIIPRQNALAKAMASNRHAIAEAPATKNTGLEIIHGHRHRVHPHRRLVCFHRAQVESAVLAVLPLVDHIRANDVLEAIVHGPIGPFRRTITPDPIRASPRPDARRAHGKSISVAKYPIQVSLPNWLRTKGSAQKCSKRF